MEDEWTRICSIYEIRTDRGKVRFSQKNLYQCQCCSPHASRGPARWEPGKQSKLRHTHYCITNKQTNKQINNINNNKYMKYSRIPSLGYDGSLGNQVPAFRGSMFLRNRLPSDAASYFRRTRSSTKLPCKSQVLHMKILVTKTIITEALNSGNVTT